MVIPEAISRRPYSRIKPVCLFETPEMLAMARGASSSARPRPMLNQPKPFAKRFALVDGKPGRALSNASAAPEEHNHRCYFSDPISPAHRCISRFVVMHLAR